MLTIACIYKTGPGYEDGTYVLKLREQITQHCREPFRFVCLSNVDIPDVECIPLIAEDRPGYWNKLEVFRPGLFEERVVCLDIDLMIINDVTDILTYPHKFTAGNCFKPKNKANLASWFRAFDGRDNYGYLFDGYRSGTPEQFSQEWSRWGDQGYLQDNLRREWTGIEELFPGRVASYKWGVRRQGFVPKGVSFVAFHGKPRPADINWRLPNGD